MHQNDIYLQPTPTIDCDNILIREKALKLTEQQNEVPDRAKSLFYFVRDEIKYNMYLPSDKIEYYRASRILEMGEGFCIQKASLLAALARAVGIPARIHLAAIRNHLTPIKLKELLRGDIFPTHGYNELYIEDKWIKVAPTFNLKLCQDNKLIPVEFDGRHDAVLPAHNMEGSPHIEYIEDRGYYDDVPFEKIINWRIERFGSDYFERMRQAIESRKSKL